MTQGRYLSSDDAAFAAFAECGPQSIEQLIEYAGFIYLGDGGGFDYTRPNPGSHDRSRPDESSLPARATVRGIYHTHGTYTVQDGAPGEFRRVDRADSGFSADPWTLEIVHDGETWGPEDLRVSRDMANCDPLFRSYLLTTAQEVLYFDPVRDRHGALPRRRPRLYQGA